MHKQEYSNIQLNLQGGNFGDGLPDCRRHTDTYCNRRPSKTMSKRRRNLSQSEDPKRIRLEIHRQRETDVSSDLPRATQNSTRAPQQPRGEDVLLSSTVTEWVQLGDEVLRRLQNNTGCRLAGKGLMRRAVVTWQDAAGAGNAAAHFNLAVCYQQGLGVHRDAEKAVCHYRAAAGLGHGGALYNLAVLTHQGVLGVTQDPGGATHLLQMAADAGVTQAVRELGVVYATSVPRDMCTAAHLFKAASLSQDPAADYFLAQCHEYGWGVERDPCQATYLYTRAAAHGHPHNHTRPDFSPGTAAYEHEAIQESSNYNNVNDSDVNDVDMSYVTDDVTSTISDDIINSTATDSPRRQQDVYLNIITEVIMVPWSCLSTLPNRKTDFSAVLHNHNQIATDTCYTREPRGPRLLRLPSHFNYGIVEDFDASMFQHYGICDKQKTIDELRKECSVPREHRSLLPPFSTGRGLLTTAGFRCNSAILEDGLC